MWTVQEKRNVQQEFQVKYLMTGAQSTREYYYVFLVTLPKKCRALLMKL